MLKGKVALVTGASRGIGKVVAQTFAGEGARVILTGSNEETLKKVQGEIAESSFIVADLSAPKKVDELAEKVLSGFGGVDILVNNAGVYSPGNASEGEPDEWEKMMQINVNAPMRLTRRLSKKMIDQQSGCIINLGSVAGIEPMSGTAAAYAASKHAMSGWTRSIYTSLRNSNIKVMGVCPGFVNTGLVAVETPATEEEKARMIQPEDVAEVCLLPFRTKAGCVPVEVHLRLALPLK